MSALRDFIAALDERKNLVRVPEEVDWKYEIGTISRATNAPLLFEKIRGYQNKKLFTNGLAKHSSIVLALGMQDEEVSLRVLAKKIKCAYRNPIEPILSAAQLNYENSLTQGIDLTVLPVPWWNELDAGRYIGTWHLNISRDPETGVRNVGIYRMQILTPNQTTVSVSPRSHLARQISIAEKKGKVLPMAVAIGVDERLIISAAAAPRYGVDELTLAGALTGKPVELVRGLTQPLEVPADSEIIIEGYIQPEVRVYDGPFLDYAGIPSMNPCAHLFEVTGLHLKKDAIFRGAAVGSPGAEDHQLYSILSCAGLADFHGSRIRHAVQTFLLRQRAFKTFQLTGRIGQSIRKKSPKQLRGCP
jgi:4-hydroxy-3-polyprenylbenzoate decarboxylase